jgi:hypothetical protein
MGMQFSKQFNFSMRPMRVITLKLEVCIFWMINFVTNPAIIICYVSCTEPNNLVGEESENCSRVPVQTEKLY